MNSPINMASTLSTTLLSGLGTTQLAAIAAADLAALGTAQWRGLSTDQVGALSPDHLAALTPAPAAALTLVFILRTPAHVPNSLNLDLALASLQPLMDAEQAGRAREELNALYVAMTRARELLVFSATDGPQVPWMWHVPVFLMR